MVPAGNAGVGADGHGCGGEELPECVGTLTAAWLMTDFGFGGGAAAAWVRML